MSGTAERVLAGAVLTRRHFLRAAAVLGVAVALPATRGLVQAPAIVVPDPPACPIKPDLHSNIADLSRLLRDVYGPAIEQQQNLRAQLYRRFERPAVRWPRAAR